VENYFNNLDVIIIATIKDVAKLANVSVSAVSKAFNSYNEISEPTKERIFAAAKELEYIPNKSAVDLSRGKRPYLGLIVNDLNSNAVCDEYIFRLLSGTHERANELGQEIIIFTAPQIKKLNKSYVDFCKHHTLVGAIVHGLDADDPYLTALLESPIPCVLIDIQKTGDSTAFVTTNNFEASKEVVDLFVLKGHKSICHIAGGATSFVTEERKNGFLQAAESHNIASENIFVIQGDFREETAYLNTKELLKAKKDITAIFAASDIMALGASRAINELGFKIGKDIALVGFDGFKAMEYTSPPIATVFQDFHAMGRIAVDTLLKIYRNQDFNPRNYVPHAIFHRGSV